MLDHAEADNQLARNRRHRFRKDSQFRRKPESNNADSEPSWDTPRVYIRNRSRGRDDSHGVNRDEDRSYARDCGGCRYAQRRRGDSHRETVPMRELRCSRKVPTRTTKPVW